MSQFILACHRTGVSGGTETLVDRARRIETRLRPSGLECRLKIFGPCSDTLIIASLFHSDGVAVHGGSAAFGAMDPEAGEWSRTGAPVPQGSFSLLRTSPEQIELVTDAMATRSVWYVFDEEKLLAASCERALVMLMEGFQPDESQRSWLVANGVAGPHGGWDCRTRRLGPESRLVLDRTTWTLDLHEPGLDFAPELQTGRDWMGEYRQATESAVNQVAHWPGDWILPLSGGYDSRVLACLLKGKRHCRTVTWGMGEGPFSTRPEARAAKELADWAGFSHEYVDVGATEVPFSEAARHFVSANEARTDHIAAYRDGFRFWRGLVEQGIDGAVLGDEAFGGFGWSPVYDELQVRNGLGLLYPRELPGLDGLDLPGIALPEALARRPAEDLPSWRYRLFHDFRIPVARAAQAETKARYVSIANPHQFHRIVRLIRRLPHEFRTDKKLLIDLARELSPPIPFRNAREGDQLVDQLQSEQAREFLTDELSGTAGIGIWGSRNIRSVLARMNESAKRTARPDSPLTVLKRAARNYLPRSVKRRLARFRQPPVIPAARLAFRMWEVVEIDRVMKEDGAQG